MAVKTYKYAVFLRNPETKETQHGTFEVDHDGNMDCHYLFDKLNNSDVIKSDMNKGYTLIAMQVVDVTQAIGNKDEN